MTTCLGKSCSSDLLCVSFMNIYQFVCVFLSFLVLRVGCGNFVLIPNHCLFIYFPISDFTKIFFMILYMYIAPRQKPMRTKVSR